MNPGTTIAVTVALSVGAAVMVTYLRMPEPPVEPESASETLHLEAEIEALRRELADLRAKAGTPLPGSTRVVVRDELDEALIEEILRRIDARAEPAPEVEEVDLAPYLRDLFSDALTHEEKQALWDKLRESGGLAAMVAALEARVAAEPQNPEAQHDLAQAYFQSMRGLSGPDAGAFGAKAAESLEAALELDENHFEARLDLAKHQYWAEMRGDSLQNLRKLIDQQAGRVAEPKHAAAYWWLGSVLMDRGDSDEALAIWQAGAALFPEHAGLQQRLATFDD